jgi:hypothetical protein
MTSALGPNFYQMISMQSITILTILTSAMSVGSPIPPFRDIPRHHLFRILTTEREPEEMSLAYVGEVGYAVFAAMSVSSQLVGHEIERCVDLMRSLVGEVNVGWNEIGLKEL